MTTKNDESTGFENAQFKVGAVPIKKIHLGEYALRTVNRNDPDYMRLRDAIASTDGPLLPIVVREIDDPENEGEIAYGLIDGLQRFSCCQDLGFETIPARVIHMEDADVAAAQIIANHSRIETKPVEYTKQLHRMLNSKPTETLAGLAGKLHVSEKWLRDRLSLAKLHEEVGKLVDEGHVPLGHAFVLAKLQPPQEQIQFLAQAQQQSIQEFSGHVMNHIKEVRSAARAGREPHTDGFTPVPHIRPSREIKSQLEDPSAAAMVCEKVGAKTPEDGFKAGIQWVLSLDPDAVEIARQQHEDRKRQENEKKARINKEKADARLAEAQRRAEEAAIAAEA